MKGLVLLSSPKTARLAFVVLASVWAVSLERPMLAQSPKTVMGVECARVAELGIDKQENLRAGLIMMGCGLAPAVEFEEENGSRSAERLGSADLQNIDLITGGDTWPHVTQSESMVWASTDGQTIVVNHNDSSGLGSSPPTLAGVSVSTDGGSTFARLLPPPFAVGHGFNVGDPIVVYNDALSAWFAGDLVSAASGQCGRQGIGLWMSPDGLDWSPGACAHVGNGDDRESMWVDNNAASPFYGRMYISWNNFASGRRIFVAHSDDGANWSVPVPLSDGFIRDIQLTGSQGSDGTVFVAGMNEGGGGLNPRTNMMYRSTDGGDTWSTIVMGNRFVPPGEIDPQRCGSYFARIAPLWRHMGWGQPGVGPDGVVHYAYAGAGLNAGDKGDIYYTRSTDDGDTWSDPIVLNTDQLDSGTGTQWMPSLSVTAAGRVQVSWYDRRNSDDGLDYEIWGIQSFDNGATWQPDAVISDILIAQPEQPDPNIVPCYAGDYNYATAMGDTNLATWTDGRNTLPDPIGNLHFQQDVYFTLIP